MSAIWWSKATNRNRFYKEKIFIDYFSEVATEQIRAGNWNRLTNFLVSPLKIRFSYLRTSKKIREKGIVLEFTFFYLHVNGRVA